MTFICFGIGVVMICQPQAPAPPAVNSCCQVYERVIRSTEEGASLGGAHRLVKERIAADDALYRCECEGWQNAACQK